MGGFASSIGDIAGKIFEESMPWRASVDSILKKFSTSAPLGDYIKNVYEPEIAHEAEHFVGQGLDRGQARRVGKSIVDAYTWGSNYQRLAQVVNNVRANHGTFAAQHVADAISVYFKEGGYGAGAPGKEWRRMAKVGLSPYTKPANWEQDLRGASRWIFTSRIAIPHLSQPLNTLLIGGLENSIKSLRDLIAEPQMMLQRVLQSGAFEYEHVDQFGKIIQGNSIFEKLFNQPGFRFLRKWQIVHAALTGEYAAKDAADRVLYHASRGANYANDINFKTASAELKALGIDHREVLQNGGLTPNLLQRAQFKGADEAMFISRGLRTPPGWEHNYAMRFAFMYRHYIFSQGKLLKDSLIRSYELARQGNPIPLMKTVAIIGAIFPAAGELIKGAEGLATGHNPLSEDFQKRRITPVENVAEVFGIKHNTIAGAADEYLDAVSHTAGLGIMYSILRSAKRNALAEVMVGPYGTTLADLGQDMYHMKGEELARDVLSRAPVVGSAASQYFLPRGKRGRKSTGISY
jgi:hypothetical protein